MQCGMTPMTSEIQTAPEFAFHGNLQLKPDKMCGETEEFSASAGEENLVRVIVAWSVIVFLVVPLSMAQSGKARTASPAALARGKYLVDKVGLCDDCHTPRNEKGEFIEDQRLQGAMVPFKPIMPMPVWADKTPPIAGLPGWEKDTAIKFFMTGIAYNGLPPRPPMPEYRFSRQDAEAVFAYLKSLAADKK